MDPEQLKNAVLFLIALILSICVHEFGHAFVADRLGDPLPRAQGRVTLNPIAHVDPIGTLLFPIIGFFMASMGAGGLIGWGKPVRISLSPRAITKKISIKTAHLLIAIAGPMMNVLFALVLSVLFFAIAKTRPGAPMLTAIAYVILMNATLAFFNLIPCPPLDGGAVLRGILPRSLEFISDQLEKFGFMLFFLLLIPIHGTSIISILLEPASNAALWWIQHLAMWAR